MIENCHDMKYTEGCLTCRNKHSDWFCSLSPQALAEYDSLGMQVTIPAGSTLFFEGQAARSVYVLCSGHMKLTTSSKDGKTLLVRLARPGDVLGLSAAISGTPYEITAQAIDPVQVKSFQRQDFLHFIERHIEGSMHTVKMINQEYRDALSDASRLALSSCVSGRVARLLLQLASGQPDHNLRFTMSLTHEDLATMLGTTRESVTRVLNEFKRKGLISIKGSAITILRKETLELLV
jgi:CRP/FNR family transcriptional regulator